MAVREAHLDLGASVQRAMTAWRARAHKAA